MKEEKKDVSLCRNDLYVLDIKHCELIVQNCEDLLTTLTICDHKSGRVIHLEDPPLDFVKYLVEALPVKEHEVDFFDENEELDDDDFSLLDKVVNDVMGVH